MIEPIACSRMPKCSVRPYGPRSSASVGRNDFSPFIVVLLLPARSADPPHSSGSFGPSAFRISPEATRVAMPFGSAGNSGIAFSQPSGNLRSTMRSSSSARCGLAARHAA